MSNSTQEVWCRLATLCKLARYFHRGKILMMSHCVWPRRPALLRGLDLPRDRGAGGGCERPYCSKQPGQRVGPLEAAGCHWGLSLLQQCLLSAALDACSGM